MFSDKKHRKQAWAGAFLIALSLAAIPAPACAQQAGADDWLGQRVVQRYNNFPLRTDGGQAVLRSGMEIHIYRVERRDGDKLWLEGDDDDGPNGWASVDQLVRLEEALAYLADRIRARPTDVFYYAVRAAVHEDRRQFDRAVDDRTKIIELEPEDPESYIGRARHWLARMEWDRAIDDLTRAIKIEPADAYCYRIRAHAWTAKHQYDQALSDCDRSIRLEPKNAGGLVARAQVWLCKQEYDKAIADGTDAIALDASSSLAYLYRGIAWGRKTEYDKAIADFDQAIRLDSHDAELYYNRAWAWQQKGDKAKALKDYAAGVELDPELKWVGAEPAPFTAEATRQDESLEAFLRALPLEHARVDVATKDKEPKGKQEGVVPASFEPVPAPRGAAQGPTADRPGQGPAATDDAPAPLSRDTFGIVEPQTPREFVVRAGDWLRVKEYDKAIADCTEAIDLGCPEPLARIYRGLAWREKKEYDKAIADYTDVIQADRQNAFALFARASAWAAKKEYAKADADLDAALRLDPQNPVTCNGRAWTWATCPGAKFRDGRKAVDLATRACELTDWNDAGIIDTFAAAHAEAGDFGLALKWQSRAIELETDAKNKADFVARLKLYQEKKPFRDTNP